MCGGSLKGEIIGNVSTRIQQLNGMLMNYYGGGFGTADEPVIVKGTIDNQLTSESTAFTLGDFVGGAAFGETGAVNTLITGKGSFSDTGILIGGSQVGEIHGQEQAITTVIDTRQFQKESEILLAAINTAEQSMEISKIRFMRERFHRGRLIELMALGEWRWRNGA